MTGNDTLIWLIAFAFGVAFVVRPRWWARIGGRLGQTPPTERQITSGAVFYFIIGLVLLALLVTVFATRLT